MLHTESQGHWPAGSVEDFKGFFLTAVYLDLVAILMMGPEQFVKL